MKKSQEESEQPAKVYQLDALTDQVNNLAGQMEKGFTQINTSVNALLVKSETQVTPTQLADNITAVKTTLQTNIEEEVNKIHLEYRPLKKTINWLLLTVAGAAIAIFGQVVFILNITKGG